MKEDDLDHPDHDFFDGIPPFVHNKMVSRHGLENYKSEVTLPHLSFSRSKSRLLSYMQVSFTILSFFISRDIMCAVKHTACEIHGATIGAHTLCPNTTDPLVCTNAMYVQRQGVALPEAIRSINSIRSLNRDIAAKKSEINTIRRAAGEVMSLTPAASKLCERATRAFATLPQRLAQQEHQLVQALSRAGLLILQSLEVAHREQELLSQKFVRMLEGLNLVLQKLILERQRVIMMLRTTVRRQLVTGAGQGRLGACRCNIFKFRKL
ncbi:hypothetical protein DL98DRAFT_662137 [Cadophora sp. DSE1049]|nr:hypothetical protein DL98DRAFT_662137 [Cadophora sp. DSE1049]